MATKTTFGQRLREARKARDFTQRSLGMRMGVSSGLVSLWESDTIDPGKIQSDNLTEAARLLGVRLEWLRDGKEPMHPRSNAPDFSILGMSVTTDDTRAIPIVSWVIAGKGAEVIDAYPRGQGEGQIEVDAETATELSRTAFALRIEGDSMAPEFQPGDVIIIDPSVAPVPGDYVVAKLDNETLASFKKYRSRGTSPNGTPIFELVPLNEDYATIRVDESNPGRVIGVMMEHRRKRRRR